MQHEEFSDNTQQQRFELRSGGNVAAIAQYELDGGTLALTHTEVLPGNEGKGLGSKIAKQALDNARGRGLRVDARCEFIASYVGKHPEYAALLVK